MGCRWLILRSRASWSHLAKEYAFRAAFLRSASVADCTRRQRFSQRAAALVFGFVTDHRSPQQAQQKTKEWSFSPSRRRALRSQMAFDLRWLGQTGIFI